MRGRRVEWEVAYRASDVGWMGTVSHYSGWSVSVSMTIPPKRASSA